MSDTMNKPNSELLEDLECPVCTHYMLPPIRMCRTGHSFCDSCFASMNHCATCRAKKSESRNYVIENMSRKFVIPCRNSVKGCTFEAKGSLIAEHEEFCDFGEWICKERCDWVGFRKDVFEHYNDQEDADHNCIAIKDWKDSTYYRIKEDYFNQLDAYLYYSFTFLFRIHNKTFMFYWKYLKNIGCLPFCVYYLGDPVESKQYFYKIRILHPTLNEDVIEIKSKCLSIKNKHFDDDLISNGPMLLRYSLLKSYCNEEGALSFEVKISKLEP